MLIHASLHAIKHFSPSKTFDPFNKNQKFKNYSELWHDSLRDKPRSPRKKTARASPSRKGANCGACSQGKQNWVKNSALAVVLAPKRQSCNNGSFCQGEKKSKKNYPPQKKWPSSLKSESFENIIISTEVLTEMCLFGKISYCSEEAAQNIRRKATVFGDQ